MNGLDDCIPKACHATLLGAAKLLLVDNIDGSLGLTRQMHDCDGAGCCGQRPCSGHVRRLLTGLNMAEMLSLIHRARPH